MSLSRRYLSTRTAPSSFDVEALASRLKDDCPEIVFAFILGSAKDGAVAAGSDIDIALFLNTRPTAALLARTTDIVSVLAPGADCDIGILNKAEPIYRFEALKGRLLFTRDQEIYLRFFSLWCREYESQMSDYKRQHGYRMEAA